MSKIPASFAAAIAFGAGFAAAAVPAQAQSSGRGMMEVIVYGNDPCPRAAEDEVVICVRRPDVERYRIPEAYRPSGPPQAGQAWANRARALERVADTGPQSCSAVGPGGHTGCLLEEIRQNREAVREETQRTTAPPQ